MRVKDGVDFKATFGLKSDTNAAKTAAERRMVELLTPRGGATAADLKAK